MSFEDQVGAVNNQRDVDQRTCGAGAVQAVYISRSPIPERETLSAGAAIASVCAPAHRRSQ